MFIKNDKKITRIIEIMQVFFFINKIYIIYLN